MKNTRLSLLVFSALLLASCQKAASPDSSGKISVVASFYPLAFLTQQIGGEYVSVHQVTPGGVEPHDFEPSPRDIESIYMAKMFVFNGTSVDAWATKLQDDPALAGVSLVNLSRTLSGSLIVLSDGQNGRTYDPHFWLQPAVMQQAAAAVRDALIKIDPTHATEYQAQAAITDKKFSDVDASYARSLSQCTNPKVIVSHDAFTYLAKRYHFEAIPIAGLSPDSEPAPRTIADLITLAKSTGIDTVFFEELASPKLSQTIASAVGAKSEVLSPIEGLTSTQVKAGEDYWSLMDHNRIALATAMHCR